MGEIISFFKKNSYMDKFPALDLIREEDVFLECVAYDAVITVAGGNTDKLNIFEQVILELLGRVGCSIDQIMEKTCLERDFVKAVCDKLQKEEYIDNANTIKAKGQNALNQRVSYTERNVKLVVLPATSSILPMLIVDDRLFQGSVDNGWMSMEVDEGNAGDAVNIKGRLLFNRHEKKKKQIRHHEIREQVRLYNQKQSEEKHLHLIPNGSLSCYSQGSKMYLHFKCGVQRGMVDQVIVSDGLSINSGILAEYLCEYHRQYVQGVQERSTQEMTVSNDGSCHMHRKYESLLQIWESLEEVKPSNNINEQQAMLQRRKDNLAKLYSAAEHALNYYLSYMPLSSKQERIFCRQDRKRNGQLICKMAEDIGLRASPKMEILGKLSKVGIKRYKKSEIPDLYVVLPMAIATCWENKCNDFRRLDIKCRCLLKDLEKLSESKSLRHGSEEAKGLVEDYEQLKDTVQVMIKILLPDCSLEGEKVSRHDISQQRLNEAVALQKVLGTDIYDRLGDNLKEDMLRVSPYYQGYMMLTPVEMVNTLYRILENYMRTRSQDMDATNLKAQEVVADVEEKASVTLPKALSSVGVNMINAALKDENASLGAYALALFCRMPEDSLERLVQKVPIIQIVGDIISMRGHGNNSRLNLTMSRDQEMKLRDRVFACIKEMEML